MRRALLIAVALGAAGCTSATPVTGRRPFTETWTTIGPRLAAACGGCHGAAAAGYRVTTYLDAIGAADRRVALAGDETSPLLSILDPSTATAPHAGQGELHAALRTWIVDDRLAYGRSQVHEGGLLDPLSSDFHGALVQARGWDLYQCASCHGADFAGGNANASCNGCHAATPTGCTTCHGAPPATGAHLAHAEGHRLGRALDCGECHLKPARWDEPGHIHGAGAIVTFGALASTATAAPAWHDGACENVYCHGASFVDAAAQLVRPTWSGGPASAACGTCHGLPPSGHPGGACATCHGGVVDGATRIVAPAAHVDGKITLGADGSGSCTSCHPSPGGAHAAHTKAAHGVAAPIACTECHVVPTTVNAPGHLSATGDAEVFPAGGSGPRAGAFSAMPRFDRASGTCADVACHGGGGKLAGDQAIGVERSPSWTGGVASCGSCHGVPPSDGLHDKGWGLTTCAACHPRSVDALGAIISGAGSTHVNGVVDVGP